MKTEKSKLIAEQSSTKMAGTFQNLFYSKTKKPQWDVWGVFSQHNKVSYLPAMQPTNWKMIILQKLSNKSESSEPQSRLFSLKAWHQGEKSTPLPRAFGFDGQRGLRAGASQDRRKQTLNCFCIHTRFGVYWDKAITPEEPVLDLPESLGESPGQVGSVVAHWGAKRMVAEGQRLLSRVSSTRGHHFGSNLPNGLQAPVPECNSPSTHQERNTVQSMRRLGPLSHAKLIATSKLKAYYGPAHLGDVAHLHLTAGRH